MNSHSSNEAPPKLLASRSGAVQAPPTSQTQEVSNLASSENATPPRAPSVAPAFVDAREGGVTPRVIGLSLLLAVFFGYVIPIIDLQVRNTYLGAGHLPVGAVGALLLFLLVVNPALKVLGSRSPQLAFSRNEMLTIYTTCLFSTLVPGMGSESLFVAHLIGSFYFATRENGWLPILEPYLKPWFTPALDADNHYGDAPRRVIEDWYAGGGAAIPWGAWLVPLVAWTALISAIYLMLGCLSVMLRAQWGEREALAFPLLRLPLELTEDDGNAPHASSNRTSKYFVPRFFRNPLMWCGFGVAVFIQGLNGLNVYYPEVPTVSLGIGTGALFTEAPWNQMAPIGMFVWPIFAAITFLLTSEVSFSLWFFLWFIQLQYIIAYYLGFPYGTLPTAIGHSSDGGARTFTAFQQVGAYVAYVAVLGWTAREHGRHILRRAFGREKKTAAEAREAISYPAAFWGFLAAFSFIIAWSWAAGLRPDVAIALWSLYLITSIALTRAIVEGGVMFINQGWVPLGTLAQLMGSGSGSWLSAQSVVPATFFQVSFFQDMRGFLMPSFLHGFKMAHDRGIAARRLWFLIFACTFVALCVGVWMKVRLGYVAGGLSLHPWFSVVAAKYPAQNAQEFIRGARDTGIGNWLWLMVGGLFTYGIVLARSRLTWFPLHPLGYLLALTAPTQRALFSFFLGWLAKVLITRFGGHEAYRKMIPVALGIILGEVSSFLFWLLIDAWQGRSGHGLLP